MWRNRHANNKSPARSIVLTGASGALGRALALHHAGPGVAMSVWGRDEAKLAATAASACAAGAEAKMRCQDLCDAPAAVAALLKDDGKAQFDTAYLVAGIGDIRADGALVEAPEQILRAVQVNFAAPAAMAAVLAERMAQRGHGRIVLVGSAAAHHSIPFAASYAASKAGLARFADALRIAVEPHGVSVTLAAPGFIDTPAARAISGDRPMQLSAEEAARRIAHAGWQGKQHYITPWPFAALKTIDAALPAVFRDALMRRLKP